MLASEAKVCCAGCCRMLPPEKSFGSLLLQLLVVCSATARFRGLNIVVLLLEAVRAFLGGHYFLDK